MERLEEIAAAEGFPLARLETGDRQPEALGLYRATGYVACGAFADYPEGPPSLFFEKRLG
jgi:putative acetyltransferase